MLVKLLSVLFIVVLGVSACQATTGHVQSRESLKGSAPCEIMPVADASINWAVFGPVTEVKNCPGRGHYKESYRLANGWGSYQESNGSTFFHEITERSFREILALQTAFAAHAETIKLHHPKIKNRPTIFAQTRLSGKNIVLFVMNSEVPNIAWGEIGDQPWAKVVIGMFHDDGNMSEDDFRKYFLERLTIFDTLKAANFTNLVGQPIRPAPTTDEPTDAPTIEERLAQLKELQRKGLLTEVEAAAKRKEILEGL